MSRHLALKSKQFGEREYAQRDAKRVYACGPTQDGLIELWLHCLLLPAVHNQQGWWLLVVDHRDDKNKQGAYEIMHKQFKKGLKKQERISWTRDGRVACVPAKSSTSTCDNKQRGRKIYRHTRSPGRMRQ